jgi:hypothetical protein
MPVEIDSHSQVIEEQFCRRVKIAVPPEAIVQNPDGSITLNPVFLYDQLAGIGDVCNEVANKTRNSTRRTPKRPRI